MEYRSISDLANSIAAGAHRLPPDIDLIVGIPRSGVLAASILAIHLNLPLLDLTAFLEGKLPEVGRTFAKTLDGAPRPRYRKALIVDDSIWTGESILKVRERLAGAEIGAEVMIAAVYGAKEHHQEVDFVFETVKQPRLFQWNLMRHVRLNDACFDIDGVLCHDPSEMENDDGERYLLFLQQARPLLRPGVAIRHLVTSRLERYRKETEEWLATQGIRYEKLWMLDLPSAEERRRLGAHHTFKAKVYKDSGAMLFVESEDRQAVRIANLSGKPVLSIEFQRMVWPEKEESARREYARAANRGTRKFHVARRLIRRVLGAERARILRSLVSLR